MISVALFKKWRFYQSSSPYPEIFCLYSQKILQRSFPALQACFSSIG